MTEKENILKELNEIAPTLALSQKNKKAYVVPENYFSALSETVLEKKNSEKEYSVPNEYFSTLQNRLNVRLQDDQNTEIIKNSGSKGIRSITSRITMLSGIAASLLLLVYVSTSTDRLLGTDADLTDIEIDSYIEQNIDDMDMDDLLVFHEEDGMALENRYDDDELIDYYIEQNIYTLEQEFLSELIE